MSSKDPNDPKIPDQAAPAGTSPQPKDRFAPQIEEDAIPWAEIIFEEEPNLVSEEHPGAQEPHPAEISPAPGLLSRISGMNAQNLEYDPLAGPPLAALRSHCLYLFCCLKHHREFNFDIPLPLHSRASNGGIS